MTNANLVVIITDDDPSALFLHKVYIEKSGLSSTTLCFPTALETLNYLKDHQGSDENHLLLLDINMPDMSGWELLDAIAEGQYLNTQAIVVSSSVNTSDHQKAQTYRHVIGYMEKPLSIEKLRDIIGNLPFSNSSLKTDDNKSNRHG